ncbi:hypothetical protein [Symbioplanes lichenis]|uniref:hypothetical protein n=1 Tax=Symbioplanes lichenis TaxID=1629072 RepID=UPI00273A17C7|nr:hypothetical protein [Actinoplanes lichenis]
MRLAEDEVRRAIRALAAAHVPDREAILSRFTRVALRRSGGRDAYPVQVVSSGGTDLDVSDDVE